jgi:hypothetical protein
MRYVLQSPLVSSASDGGAGALQSDQFTPSNDGAKLTTPDSARRVTRQRNSSLTPTFHLELRLLLQILVVSFFTSLTHCAVSDSNSRSSHSICFSLSPFLVTSQIPSNRLESTSVSDTRALVFTLSGRRDKRWPRVAIPLGELGVLRRPWDGKEHSMMLQAVDILIISRTMTEEQTASAARHALCADNEIELRRRSPIRQMNTHPFRVLRNTARFSSNTYVICPCSVVASMYTLVRSPRKSSNSDVLLCASTLPLVWNEARVGLSTYTNPKPASVVILSRMASGGPMRDTKGMEAERGSTAYPPW